MEKNTRSDVVGNAHETITRLFMDRYLFFVVNLNVFGRHCSSRRGHVRRVVVVVTNNNDESRALVMRSDFRVPDWVRQKCPAKTVVLRRTDDGGGHDDSKIAFTHVFVYNNNNNSDIRRENVTAITGTET